jgi:uncharacterized protein YutE (UPF0331/DUF86 family)
LTKRILSWSEEGIIDILVKQGVITEGMGKKMKEMKGFRNILVHRYRRKDDG